MAIIFPFSLGSNIEKKCFGVIINLLVENICINPVPRTGIRGTSGKKQGQNQKWRNSHDVFTSKFDFNFTYVRTTMGLRFHSKILVEIYAIIRVMTMNMTGGKNP